MLGYSNHQLIVASCAAATALAAGTFLNVRSFDRERFLAPDEEDRGQKRAWYYCPKTLSEYRVVALDMAHRQKVLDLLRVYAPLPTHYSASLFAGPQPSTVGLSET